MAKKEKKITEAERMENLIEEFRDKLKGKTKEEGYSSYKFIKQHVEYYAEAESEETKQHLLDLVEKLETDLWPEE